MIAVDTNILVYAHRRESPFHAAAAACVRELAEGDASWAIPWPCVHEFLGITTNPKIFTHPTPIATALAQVDLWRECPSLKLIGEDESYWAAFAEMVRSGEDPRSQVHDARIAAIVLSHGARELLSADRDSAGWRRCRSDTPLRTDVRTPQEEQAAEARKTAYGQLRSAAPAAGDAIASARR